MSRVSPHPEPRRPTEAARLELATLPPDVPLADVFARACELAAGATRIARVGVWLYVDDRTALRCAHLFESASGEQSSGAILRIADFPTYFAALTIRKAVPAEVAASDPRTAELAAAYLDPLGITSMLDAGVFVQGELVGVVCFEHVGPPREWTTEDRDFAGSVADLIALRVQSAEVADLRTAFRNQASRMAALDKADALEHLAAGVAHDFRNLLSVIAGNADLLAEQPDLPESLRPQVRAITDAAQAGADLVKDLLAFAHPAERPPVVLNPADVVAGFLPILRAAVGPRHRVRFARPAHVGQVLVENGQFLRVLMNLAVNARDALPAGGDIDVRVAPVQVAHGSAPPAPCVLVEVRDRGVGMDEATRKRAFEPFYTTKAKGTGLGLAVVRRVVDLAGGWVRIQSMPGEGTTVRAFFPRVGAGTGGTTEFHALPTP